MDEAHRFADAIAFSERILVFSGAGISTPSGIPDFRGPQGVWKKREPVYYQDFMRSEASRVDYWDYKLEGWPAFSAARPNPVHQAIVDLERAGKLAAVVTQNVDGLHSMAGTSSDKLVEIHGTNALVECQGCGKRTDPRESYEFFDRERSCPRCGCGGCLKPATISFGQSLRRGDLDRAYKAAAACDLVISLGSTLSVEPAASIPFGAARAGNPYFIVNSGGTTHDGEPCVSGRLDGRVEEIFPPAVALALASGSDKEVGH